MRLLTVLVVVLVAGVSSAAAQGVCGGGCNGSCYWIYGGGGWMCGPGFAGCLCETQGGACMYYNCNEQEEEEDAAASSGGAQSMALLAVSGDLYVAVDACLRRPPLVLPLGNVARIETSPWPAGAQRE